MKTVFFLIWLLSAGPFLFSQNFTGLHGSGHATTLNVLNNPASIVNTPYTWELNVFSIQSQGYSNAITASGSGLIKMPGNSTYSFAEGNFGRSLQSNANLSASLRMKFREKHSLAFGANLRGYGDLNTSPFNYVKSIRSVDDFFASNMQTSNYVAELTSSSWMELFGSFATTLKDSDHDRINAGVSLKASLGLSGAYAQIQGVNVSRSFNSSGQPQFLLSNGYAEYGYSKQYEGWAESPGFAAGMKQHLKSSKLGLSIDLGAEYLLKEDDPFQESDNDQYTAYKWKFGAALMDFGFNSYTYSGNSRRVSGIIEGVTAADLESRFESPRDILELNDSIASMVVNSERLPGNFKVSNPARLLTYIDRNIGRGFHVNAQLVLHLSQLASTDKLSVTESQLLTITPRWENRTFGFYLPVQYNMMKQIWIGTALRAGPVVLGVHNLTAGLQSDKALNGGFYLALIFKPGRENRRVKTTSTDCPPEFR